MYKNFMLIYLEEADEETLGHMTLKPEEVDDNVRAAAASCPHPSPIPMPRAPSPPPLTFAAASTTHFVRCSASRR